ncbi:MAG: M4 family metallopeptidase [Bacteroidales bacterium]|nr:M4 family metallopeptidase [Bacteroidales bacterium]MCF8456750.1 M4 family metallopeptidase [Bacteroidales bacterium]
MNKLFKITAILLVLLFSQSLQAQVYYGPDANQKIQGSETVRVSARTDIPTYIKFREADRFQYSFLESYLKKQFRLSTDFSLRNYQTDKDAMGGTLYRYVQLFKGAEINDARINVLVENDQVASISGFLYNNIQLQNTPMISKETAFQNALLEVPAEVYKWEIEGEEILIKESKNDPEATYCPKGELVLFPSAYPTYNGSYKYAYKFDIYADKPINKKDVFIDAENGKVLITIDRLLHADVTATALTKYSGTREITSDSYNGSFRLRETGRGNGVETYDMNEGTSYSGSVDFTDADNYWNNFNTDFDEVATDAHWGAEMTYDYFFYKHNRNSIDNNGFKLKSYVHYDVAYSNAFWDGTRMTYGDGSGSTTPFTALDICGHEIAHGLTTFTADLDYAYESGALNEAFSDIFGASIEFYAKPTMANWLIGENIGSVIRSMSNPNLYNQPDTYHGNSWYFGSDDNGGVHYNSGVLNYWYYLVCQGGSGTNDLGNPFLVTGIGMDDAGKIAFRTLVTYLTNSSQYEDARFYSIIAAIDLFGACSAEVEAVTRAWYAVGIGSNYVNYVMSAFTSDFQQFCSAPAVVNFQNMSVNGTIFTWDFGDNSTSTSLSPSHIYSNYGTYSVSLMSDGGTCGSDTLVQTAYINIDPSNPCVEILSPTAQFNTQTSCFGTLFDSGGMDNYQDNTDYSITIAPVGALNVTLTFISFNFEIGYDYLYVYDGPSTSSTLIGQYDGASLPNLGTITSTGPSITIRQVTDPGVTESGFELDWACNFANTAPVADFNVDQEESCSGDVFFHDMSANGATSWLWDFGDGSTSSFQHPSHSYSSNGVFTVQLIATNAFGADTVIKINYVSVINPEVPVAVLAENCGPASFDLTATGFGLKAWFADTLGENLLHVGDTFTTPNLTQSTEYYVSAYALSEPDKAGKTNNSGSGNYFTNNGEHYLVFDCYAPMRLLSVKVYAGSNGNRTISLNDENGNTLQQKTVFIPGGESRVYLNFNIQPGVNYQLAGPSAPDLFRNDNMVNEYPFTLNGVASVKYSSASSSPTGYYYYFYDWDVMQGICESDLALVMAYIQDQVVQAGFSFQGDSGTITFTNTSIDGTWFEWDFGDGLISNDANPVHHYSQVGTYQVSLIASNACGQDSVLQTVDITITGFEDGVEEAQFSLYPNPNVGIFNLNYSIANGSQEVSIEVFNLLGERVYFKKSMVYSAKNSERIDLSNHAKGIYHIRLSNGGFIRIAKVVIH